MIAVLWAELTDWNQAGRRHCLILLTLSLGGVFLITMARPDWCLVTLTANLIWVGFRTGRGDWNPILPEDWLETAGLKPWQVTWGKLGAVLCLNLLQILVSVPILAALAGLWGIPPGLFVNLCLLWLGATAVAALLPLAFNQIGNWGDSCAIAILGGWLVGSFMTERLSSYNPFVMVYRMLQGQTVSIYQWLIASFVTAAALILLLTTRLRRVVKPQ